MTICARPNAYGVKENGNPFAFNLNTFVFVKDNVSLLNTADLLSYHPARIKYLGILSDTEYKRLIKCIKGSKHLKFKVKRIIDSLSN